MPSGSKPAPADLLDLLEDIELAQTFDVANTDDLDMVDDDAEIADVVEHKKEKPGMMRITMTHGNILVVRNCRMSVSTLKASLQEGILHFDYVYVISQYAVTRSGFSMREFHSARLRRTLLTFVLVFKWYRGE